MSKSKATQIYTSECRGCDRTVRRPIPITMGKTLPPGKHVRCAKCKTTNWAEPENDGLDVS